LIPYLYVNWGNLMRSHTGFAASDEQIPGPLNHTWAIFLVSVLGLFLEMLVIRLLSTEVRIFAYLQNTVLVVCFLGLGLGCFTSRQPIRIRQSLIPLAILVLLLAVPTVRFTMGEVIAQVSRVGDMQIWNVGLGQLNLRSSVLVVFSGLLLIYCLMILVVDVFVPIGRILGRLMDDSRDTIRAYSINLAGSLVGTWLFVLLSAFYLPPVIWFLVLVVLYLLFLPRASLDRRIVLTLAAIIPIASWFVGQVPGALDVVWSPYQKLVVSRSDPSRGMLGDYWVTVNNTGYQMMADLRESRTSTNPNLFPPTLSGLSQYDIPLLVHPAPQSYLIVGAGAGNDAAGGLRHDVKSVTAVEIDPAIIALGRRYHPEAPYASPAVTVVNDDARSFFATTDQRFDVIAFGLLDSHTTTTMTNARLDHYVYTRESISRAKRLLAPGGVMVLNFAPERQYIADRMAVVLRDVFGEDPIVFLLPLSGYGYGGVMFLSGDLDVVRGQIAQNPRLAKLITTVQQRYPLSITYTTKATTDDWPYLYLAAPSIPPLYYVLAGLLAVIVVRSYKRWGVKGLIRGWRRSDWHFFFLGAAFLLLEVQSISKASVVLGNTWQVNAVIVSGVLVMALLANLVAHKWPKLPIGLPYTVLIGTCLALYFVDLAQFAFLPYVTKALLIGGLITLPMLFSGIIFIRSFAAAEHKDQALGANMIGSIFGALLQSLTFLTGIRSLLLVVAALYVLSLVARSRPGPQTETAPPVAYSQGRKPSV
jgi:hypothetical protein